MPGCHALSGVGHGHGAVVHQQRVVEHRVHPRQRVVRRDAEDELQLAQRTQFDAAGVGVVAANADRQIHLARDQGFPGACQHLAAQTQPRRRSAGQAG